MPEDAEVPTEHLQEAAEHNLHRQHEASHGNQELRWPSLAALSAAFFAVFAAISALLAGHDANEAMIEQIRGSDGYAYYQATDGSGDYVAYTETAGSVAGYTGAHRNLVSLGSFWRFVQNNNVQVW